MALTRRLSLVQRVLLNIVEDPLFREGAYAGSSCAFQGATHSLRNRLARSLSSGRCHLRSRRHLRRVGCIGPFRRALTAGKHGRRMALDDLGFSPQKVRMILVSPQKVREIADYSGAVRTPADQAKAQVRRQIRPKRTVRNDPSR